MRRIALVIAFVRQFLDLFKAPPKPDPMLLLMEHLVKNQETQAAMMAEAMRGVFEASKKQADVLQGYLDLFKGGNDPERWTRNEKVENLEDLKRDGFPIDASEAEQAEWILKHM